MTDLSQDERRERAQEQAETARRARARSNFRSEVMETAARALYENETKGKPAKPYDDLHWVKRMKIVMPLAVAVDALIDAGYLVVPDQE
jgi:hypothetical protein